MQPNHRKRLKKTTNKQIHTNQRRQDITSLPIFQQRSLVIVMSYLILFAFRFQTRDPEISVIYTRKDIQLHFEIFAISASINSMRFNTLRRSISLKVFDIRYFFYHGLSNSSSCNCRFGFHSM